MANARQFMAARTAAWSGKSLPYLRRVAYLETTSQGPFIKLGFTADRMTTARIRFSMPNPGIGGYDSIFGGRVAANSSSFCLFTFGEGGSSWRFQFNYHGIGTINSTAKFLRGTVYEAAITPSGVSGGDFIKNIPSSTGDFTSPELRLFDITGRGGNKMFVGRVYDFGLERNETQLLSLIPVLDLYGRPAMYDEVSGQLFYNQGTGEFTWGELET